MGVVVRKTFGRLRDVRLVTREDMREVGRLVIERLLERTSRGVDADGQAFAPYSRGYADQKRKAVGTSRVNLRASGEMLNALRVVDVTDRSVTVGFIR